MISMYVALYLSLLAFVDARIYPLRYACIFLNAFFLLLAVAGYAFLLSCLINDQRRTIVLAVGIMLIMFVADMMLELSDTLRDWNVLSLFCYFRPAGPLTTGRMPWSDVGVLAASAAFFFAATLAVFRRKEISG
jgi:ABC-type transport system involved in multi-copper enzyme maturation permease subunit